MPFRAEYEPRPGEEHWFPIDRSILAERGLALHGSPAREVFAPIPRETLLPVLLTSLEWHGTGAGLDDVVLNAARSLRFVLEGTWSAKREAGRWALEALEDAHVVADALAARAGGGYVDPAEAERFRQLVVARMLAA